MNNVVNEYTEYVLKQFSFYAKKIMGKYYNNSIFTELAKEYINIRYYNIYPQKQNNKTTISYYLNQKIKEITENNPKKIESITFMVDILNHLIYLDSDIEASEVNKVEKELEEIRKKYDIKEKLEFSKEYREFKKNKKEFIKQYETDDFYIDIKKTKEKNLYNTMLKYNLKMPELYSDKAIEDVYNKGLVAEDKLFVLYNLLAINILKEIINYEYLNVYLIEFNFNLLNKQEKFNRLLKIIDNDVTKEKLCFKINYKMFKQNKDDIFKMINNGYNFAIIKDHTYEENEYESLFKYILDSEV